MRNLILLLSVFISQTLMAQNVKNCHEIHPEKEYENIHIKKIDSDANKTSYIIWVKEGVKAHKHEYHTETLYVLEGEGEMLIADQKYQIKEGDYINVPQNAVHSVVVSSKTPLKVISIQAPEFLGKDRIFVD